MKKLIIFFSLCFMVYGFVHTAGSGQKDKKRTDRAALHKGTGKYKNMIYIPAGEVTKGDKRPSYSGDTS